MDGTVAKRRISESVDGFGELTAMLAAAGDARRTRSRPRSRYRAGCWWRCRAAFGRPVYPVNPLAVALGAGRQRRVSTLAAGIVATLRVPQLRRKPAVEPAMVADTLALLGALNPVCEPVGQLTATLTEAFRQHLDYQIITSLPGLADSSGAQSCSP